VAGLGATAAGLLLGGARRGPLSGRLAVLTATRELLSVRTIVTLGNCKDAFLFLGVSPHARDCVRRHH
jgi:hypothetical protein